MVANNDTTFTIKAIDRFTQPLASMGRGIASFTKNLNKLDNAGDLRRLSVGLDRVSRKFKGFAKSGAIASATIGAGFTALLSPATRFERALNEVQSKLLILDDSDKGLMNLRQVMLDLGRTTELTANEVADGAKYLAQAGFNAGQIEKSLKDVVNLKLAGGEALGLKEASDIASDVGTAFFGQKGVASQMQRLADVLAFTSSRSNTDVLQMGEAFKMVGAVSKDFGASIESVAGALGFMANVGVKGTLAGTGLRRFMLELTSGKNAETLQNLGVRVVDTGGNLRDLNQIIIDLGNATGKLDQADRIRIYEKLFGKLGITTASSLSKASNELKKFVVAIENSEGSAETIAKVASDDALGGFRALLSAVQGLAIAIGSTLQDDLKKLFKSMATFVNRATDWVKNNQKLVKGILKVGVAIGVIVGGFTVLAGAVAAAVVALKGVLVVLGGFKAVTVIVGAVTASFVVLSKVMDKIKSVIERIKHMVSIFKNDGFMALLRFMNKDKTTQQREIRGRRDSIAGDGGLEALIRKRAALNENINKTTSRIRRVGSETSNIGVQKKKEIMVRFENAPKGLKVINKDKETEIELKYGGLGIDSFGVP